MKHLKENPVWSDISPKRIGISAAIGLGVILLAVFFLAALVSKGTIGPDKMSLCAGGAVGLGGLVAAFLSAGKRKKLVTALITAVCLLLLLTVVGLLFFTGAFSFKIFAFILIILAVSCMIGSVISGFFK